MKKRESDPGGIELHVFPGMMKISFLNSGQAMTSTTRVRRPIGTKIVQAAWTLFVLYRTIEAGPSAQYVWGILLIISTVISFRILVLNKYYMEAVGSRLMIHGNFTTRSVEIPNIERMEVRADPVSSSTIILRENKGTVRFDFYKVHNRDFNELTKALKIPVS